MEGADAGSSAASATAMAKALEDLQLVVGDSTESAAVEGDSIAPLHVRWMRRELVSRIGHLM